MSRIDPHSSGHGSPVPSLLHGPSQDPDEPLGTAHALHFLLRTLRCQGEDRQRAMRLYHHSAIVRRVVQSYMAAHPELERAAVPLREHPPSPHVIVTRDGQFVTCLDENMGVDLLPLPYALIEAEMGKDDLRKGNTKIAQQQLLRMSPSRLAQAMLDGYGHVTREMIDIVLELPLTYTATLLQLHVEAYKTWVKVRKLARDYPDEHIHHQRQLRLEALCRMSIPLFGATDIEPMTGYLGEMLLYRSMLESDVIAALCRHQLGAETLLRLAVNDEVPPRTRELITGYLGSYCVHFPQRAAELIPRIRALPFMELQSSYYEEMRALYDHLMAGPPEEVARTFEAQRAKPLHTRIPASPLYQISEQDYMNSVHAYFPVTELFPPAAVADGVRKAWARHLRERPPRVRSTIKQVVHSGPRVGRNDPCSCGSGRKVKHCCGVDGAGAGRAGAAAPVVEAPAPQPV